MSVEQSEVEAQLEEELVQDGKEVEDKTPEGFVPVDENQRQVNKVFRKFKETERAHDATKRELEEVSNKLQALEAKAKEVEIPPLPDPLAENFDELQRDREEKIKLRAAADRETELAQEEEQRKAERAAAVQKEADEKAVQGFYSRATELGLKAEEVAKAAQTVFEYGVSEGLDQALTRDEDGPLIVQYLAQNPLEVQSLSEKSIYEIAHHIETEVRPKAQLLKPKTSKAPDPPETLDGGGVEEIEDPLLKGAKFE